MSAGEGRHEDWTYAPEARSGEKTGDGGSFRESAAGERKGERGENKLTLHPIALDHGGGKQGCGQRTQGEDHLQQEKKKEK